MLTDEQYREIGRKLIGTGINAYNVSSNHYDHEWTDKDFDKLQEIARIFRCENCDVWRDIKDMDSKVAGMCRTCVDEIDGIEPDGPDW